MTVVNTKVKGRNVRKVDKHKSAIGMPQRSRRKNALSAKKKKKFKTAHPDAVPTTLDTKHSKVKAIEVSDSDTETDEDEEEEEEEEEPVSADFSVADDEEDDKPRGRKRSRPAKSSSAASAKAKTPAPAKKKESQAKSKESKKENRPKPVPQKTKEKAPLKTLCSPEKKEKKTRPVAKGSSDSDDSDLGKRVSFKEPTPRVSEEQALIEDLDPAEGVKAGSTRYRSTLVKANTTFHVHRLEVGTADTMCESMANVSATAAEILAIGHAAQHGLLHGSACRLGRYPGEVCTNAIKLLESFTNDIRTEIKNLKKMELQFFDPRLVPAEPEPKKDIKVRRSKVATTKLAALVAAADAASTPVPPPPSKSSPDTLKTSVPAATTATPAPLVSAAAAVPTSLAMPPVASVPTVDAARASFGDTLLTVVN